MGKIYEVYDGGDLYDDEPHEVSELICIACRRRWIGVYPLTLHLQDIECKCGQIGFVIKTGQTLTEEDLE